MIKKIFALLFIALSSCEQAPTSQKPVVLVSIAPYRFLVEKISGNAIEIQLIVPPNTNPHIFEPTSRQVTKIRNGVIWFQIGEPFEDKISPLLKKNNPSLILSDLRDKIDLIPEIEGGCHHCSKNHLDRHIWLNPQLALIQAEEIEKILTSRFPEQENFFKKNLAQLKIELSQLDSEISSRLKHQENKTFLVSHPAFGYFCKKYNLHQLSVEYEGKDPRPRYLDKLLKDAGLKKVKVALTLPQYNNKGTLLISKKLNLQTQMIDPYSDDYFTMMRSLTEMVDQ